MKDRVTGKPRGFGFVTFEDDAVADAVVNVVHCLDGREVRVAPLGWPTFLPLHRRGCARGRALHGNLRSLTLQPPSQIDAKRSVPQDQKPKSKKIFVGGLAPETTEGETGERSVQ